MDDSQIISMLFDRNDKALGIINEKYGNLLYRLAENILHCREDSTECVNDTYLAVWNNIPPHTPNPFVAFICKITRNLSLKKLREKTAQKRNAQTLPIHELEFTLADCSFEQSLDARELARKLDRFLDTLDRDSRVVFMKRYWFCDEISEIARAVNSSESNVYQKLSRTRKKLRTFLEKEGVII